MSTFSNRISNNKKKNSVNDKLIVIFLAPFIFFISYQLLVLYTGGDQLHYHAFYDALHGANLKEIADIAIFHVTSAEPLTGFILWVGSNLEIDKNIYISFLNLLFITGIILLFRSYRISWILIFFLLTNFYVLVLITTAERLKISYIFLVYAALFEGKLRLLFMLVSPFAHLQSLILILSFYLSCLDSFFKKIFFKFYISKKQLIFLILTTFISIVIVLLLFEGISRKVSSYISFEERSLFEFLNIFILFTITFSIVKHKFKILLGFLPLYSAVIAFGSSRINMIAITFCLYLLLIEGKLHHPAIYLIMFYLSLKSILYVSNIVAYGNGFGGFLW